MWTGYIASFKPTASFMKNKKNYSDIKKFLSIISENKVLLFFVSLATFILIIMGIISSFYFKYIIDKVLESNSINTLHLLSIAIMIMTLFQILFEAVRKHLLLRFSIKVDFQLLSKYITHVLKLPLSIFDKRKTGEIISRMEDVQKVRNALSVVAISVVMDTLMALITGSILLLQASSLFIVTVITIICSTLVIIFYTKPYNIKFRSFMAESANTQAYLVEAINGISTIKSLNAEEIVIKEYEKLQNQVFKHGYELGKIKNIQTVLIDLIDGWSGKLIFWIGMYLILNSQMSLGSLISFTVLLELLISPLRRLVEAHYTLQESLIAVDRLTEVLDLEIEKGKNIPEKIYECLKGDIEFNNVSFTYGFSKTILNKINFKINSGTSVAIVGESGSGKSTLIKLLLKLYIADSGSIMIGNHDIDTLDSFTLRKKIGYVPQDIFLFSGSIYDNIVLHNPEATMNEVEQVCKQVLAHGFITKLSEGYQTKISERGASLSGGERQRIALARAIIGNPDIIIFDEATSQLDSVSEMAIHDMILNLNKRRITTIIVTHRLSTIERCDNIFIIKNGSIVESGSHSDLIAYNGHYAKLWNGMSAQSDYSSNSTDKEKASNL